MHSTKPTLLVCLVLVLCATGAAQSTYLYVGNYFNNNVSGYAVNRVTGTLTPVPNSPFAAGSNPGYVSIDRQCRFAYVANQSSQNVSAYSIDMNNGNLISLPGSPFLVTDPVPAYMSIDQFGKFLFVPMQGAGGNGSSMVVFAIDGDMGVLTPVAGSPFNTGGVQPASATVDPSNRFVYVANENTNTVSGFTFDPNTAALTPIPGSPWSTSGSRPIVVRTDNTGRFAYVTNRSSIAMFTIDQTTGALTPINGSPLPVGFDLYFMAFDVTNKYMYVADNNDAVYGYSINSSTGALTALPGFPINTDSPQGNAVFAVDPGGGLLYTSGFGGSNTVSSWAIDSSTGALTQLSRVPTGSYPASIAVCTADAEGALARVVGNNTYDGNQSVNGNVTASSFFGNGAGLTGVNAVTLGGTAAANYARLDISNSFTGNQTVNGSIFATAFSGSGPGLTSLSPGNISPGTADINISGTAAVAVNSANLGGVTAANYARVDVGNSFNGNQNIAGNVSTSGNLSAAGTTTLGGGTPILEHLSATFNPSFPVLKPSTCATANFTLAGASDGDTLALGVPNARTTGGGTVLYFAWVSAANTITIQACNVSASPQKTAGSGAIRVDLWKH